MKIKSKILGDNTLVVTVPKGTEVGRVLVEQAGTQVGRLYYPEVDTEERNDNE